MTMTDSLDISSQELLQYPELSMPKPMTIDTIGTIDYIIDSYNRYK